MPVVNITLDRLKKLLPGVKVDKALDMLPFVGLDIEGIDDNVVRVEYNPNRPDFSSDYGIVRALAGLLGKEKGISDFKVSGKSGLEVRVDPSVKEIRPIVVGLAATNGRLDDETIKQLIAMQEDLHNGLGRRRKKASIGIHNLDQIKFPVRYTTVDSKYSFVPLEGSSSSASKEQTIEQILQESEAGRAYGHLLQGIAFPIMIDSLSTAISLPPIINAQATRIDESCKNLFVEVTATDKKAADDILAVIAITLYDAGFKIKTVTISTTTSTSSVTSARRHDPSSATTSFSIDSVGKMKIQEKERKKQAKLRKEETPDVKPRTMLVDASYINDILGLSLSSRDTVDYLRKSRLDAKMKGAKKSIAVTIPRYRTDITHKVDLAEEVAIGYGIYQLEPTFPLSPTAGQRSELSHQFYAIRQIMTGIGMLEAFNFSLTSKEVQYTLCNRSYQEEQQQQNIIEVDSTKSSEHEVLRSSLVPSLLQSLSRNIHEEYPQKLFEIGKTFHRKDNKIKEIWRVGAVIAHADAGFTEAKSALQALLSQAFGINDAITTTTTKPSEDPLYIKGRVASISFGEGKDFGTIGEITPFAIDGFKLRVPVAAFEIDLSTLLSFVEDKSSSSKNERKEG